jgi:hypothetical protein
VLSAAGLSFVRLDGSTTAANRARAVEAFQSGAVDVFLLSLKAGGFGLNLTAADYVVHLDPWWNPAAEAQATDRAHRIGQTRPVTVYRLVASGTIEDSVVQMQADKRALFSAVLDGEGTHAAGARWTEDELLTLLAGADAARTENDDDDDGTSVPPTMPAPASMESPARSSAESPATSSTESPATSSHARGRKPRKAKAPLYSGGHLQ